MSHDKIKRLRENLLEVQDEISSAAQRDGRTEDDITLVAVTKYVDVETTQAIVAAGCTELGESRPQQLVAKAEKLTAEPIRWHLVGKLQRNKARRVLPLVSLLHSVDSPKLLATIDRICFEDQLPRSEVLLEVNISGDADKHGVSPEQLPAWIDSLGDISHVRIAGLMGMASLVGGATQASRDFNALRDLRNKVERRCPPPHSLGELSMGMSRDFSAAIEAGATIVRVGSRLFEGILT